MLISYSGFVSGVKFASHSIQGAIELLYDIDVSRGDASVLAFQIPHDSESNILVVLYTKFLINWSANIFIFLGFIAVSQDFLYKYLKKRYTQNLFSSNLRNINPVYLVICIIGFSLMFLNILIPSIGYGYELSRVHFMFIGILTPFLILGIIFILNTFKEIVLIANFSWLSDLKRLLSIGDAKMPGIITAMYILIFLSCSMGVIDFTFGRPMILLDHDSDINDNFIISDSDSFAAKWICHTRDDDYKLFFSKPLGYLWMSGQSGVSLNERQDLDNIIGSNKLNSYYLSYNSSELYNISKKNKPIKIYHGGDQTSFFRFSTDIQ